MVAVMSTSQSPRATLTVSLPRPIRAAIVAESDRRGLTPSAVITTILARHLPRFIADDMRRCFENEDNGLTLRCGDQDGAAPEDPGTVSKRPDVASAAPPAEATDTDSEAVGQR